MTRGSDLTSSLLKEGLTPVGSMDELEAALEEGYPSLLYWMGHASPEFLRLGEHEVITPFALRNLLLSFYDRESLSGTLVFLNASWTAKVGSEGSFLNVLQNIGFTGAIVTEGPVMAQTQR